MKVVVDTNIVFSALLNTESRLADLLMNSPGVFQFYTCQTLEEEIQNHQSKLLSLSGLDEEQLAVSIFQIMSHITLINEASIPIPLWAKAASLVRDIDMNDVAFIALADFCETKIWTGDKVLIRGLVKKGYLNFISTEELINIRSIME